MKTKKIPNVCGICRGVPWNALPLKLRLDETYFMTITLRPITKENWRSVYNLTETLSDEQQHFVAPNAYSMLEAIWDADELNAFGIYDDETPVGFYMRGYDADKGDHWVVRLMIGGEHQRKGYGRAGLALAIEEFRSMPDCKEVYISFMPNNHAARALYESLGFRDTGRMDEDELVFRLLLLQNQVS
jgi:diamine N-acetyltransferase